MQLQKNNSILKKIKTIFSGGISNIKAIEVGIKNYNNPTSTVENLALKRIKKCQNCIYYIHEPNKLLRVNDSKILEADEMMCGDCGCSLPYKIRQSIKKCKQWEK